MAEGLRTSPLPLARREQLRSSIAAARLHDKLIVVAPDELEALLGLLAVIAQEHPMPEAGSEQACDICEALVALGVTDEEAKWLG